MAEAPFATVDDLKARWPDFPTGADSHAEVLLEDASQFILDTVPQAVEASEVTLRRIVCAVVRRAMAAENPGMDSFTDQTGPFSFTAKVTNPNGDFYLTKAEKAALGDGQQVAFGADVTGTGGAWHWPWCDIVWSANRCSCGSYLTQDSPLWEYP